MEKQDTLLIIDDEADICLLMERIMKRYFHVVAYSYLLSEGLKKAIALKPTHVLLDNNLPDGHGLNAVPLLKKSLPSVRIVVVSALDIANEAIGAGADAFLSKPLNMTLTKQALMIK